MYAVRPFCLSQVCVKIQAGDYEISIAFDDSCGKLHDLARGDIKIYDLNGDVTHLFQKETVQATIENLMKAYSWCKFHSFRQEDTATIKIFGVTRTMPKTKAMHELWVREYRCNYADHVVSGITFDEYFNYCCEQDRLEFARIEWTPVPKRER